MSLTLTNLREMPPRGYIYHEVSIDWRTPPDLALQGLETVARALQIARAQNPKAGLDPSYEACLEAVKRYTCKRFVGQPKMLAKFCADIVNGEMVAMVSSGATPRRPGCASCGGKRR